MLAHTFLLLACSPHKHLHAHIQTHAHKIRLAYLENGHVLACCASFLLMMYTDIHSVLFQFAFNQWRFMVIHGLCCCSQSNPGSGPRRSTADRAVNYLLQWRSKINPIAYKFSAQQFKGQPSANCSSAQPREAHLVCCLRKYFNS